MAPMPRSEFVRLVRGLSADAFQAFVADVWRGRGRTVRQEAGGILATEPATGESEFLWTVAGDGGSPSHTSRPAEGAPGDRTVRVTARDTTGTGTPVDSTVTADELYRLLRYALSEEAADRVARSHFDRPFHRASPTPTTPDVPESEPRPTPAHQLRDALAPESTARGVVLAGVLLLLLAGVLGVTATQIGPAGPPAATNPSAADPVGTPAGEQTPTAVPSGAGEPSSDRSNRDMADVAGEHDHPQSEKPDRTEALPPGLGPRGIGDADRLAASHAMALRNTSYRLEIVHREYVNGRATGLAREDITVASPTEHRSTIERVGALRGDPLVVADRPAYADGQFRYERLVRGNRTGFIRTSPTPLRDGLHGRDRYLLRTGTYVRWFLSVETSWIAGTTTRDGVRYYWVVTQGEPFPGYPNAQGSALVDENGVVHEIHRTYDEPGRRSGEIGITIRFIQFGNVTVTPPEWIDSARDQVGPDGGPVTSTPASTATPAENASATESGSGSGATPRSA